MSGSDDRAMTPPTMGEVATGQLRLAPGLRIRTDLSGHVRVDTPLGGMVDAGPHGLAIMSLFTHPRTLGEALLALAALPQPRPARVPAEATIITLIEAGAIIEAGATDVRFGWTDPAEHARMLDDTTRTDAFVAAIRASVRPDDIVLDIGTGSGILAIIAAQAGARHVYAIEGSDIAPLAAQAFRANGVADRVTLIEGWSTDVSLPQPATLLVSEIIGAEPLEEDILRTTLDARQRLLAPGARLIPHRLRLAVRAVSVPRLQRWASRIDPASIRAWRERYGVDLEALWQARRREPLAWTVEGMTAATWPVLSPGTIIADIDLAGLTSAAVDAETEIVVDRPGTVDAILLTFEAHLGDDIVLTGPPWPATPSSWDTSVWFLPQALSVRPGSRLRVAYRFGVADATDGLSCDLLDPPLSGETDPDDPVPAAG